jgi:hypothetical protein
MRVMKMKRIMLALLSILPMLLTVACEQIEFNAYVVSSELRAAPIIDSETAQTVGQAYDGFAIALNDIRDNRAYFFLLLSDPSIADDMDPLPNIAGKIELYIPIEHMKEAYVELQNVPAIISLDTITIDAMAGISLFKDVEQQVIARFNDEIGPMQFIQNIENGYLFILGMNLIYVSEQDVKLTKYIG